MKDQIFDIFVALQDDFFEAAAFDIFRAIAEEDCVNSIAVKNAFEKAFAHKNHGNKSTMASINRTRKIMDVVSKTDAQEFLAAFAA